MYFASIYAPYIASVLTAVINALPEEPEAPAEQKQMSPLEQAIAQRLAAKKEAERKEAQKKAAPTRVAPSQIRQWTRHGLELYRQGDYAEAIKDFRRSAYSGDEMCIRDRYKRSRIRRNRYENIKGRPGG